MVDSYTLVFRLLLTAGSLGDRFGRRGALQVGLAVFGLGSLPSAASSPSQLIASRSLMGIGGAFIMPGTLSLITSVFQGKERGRATAIWAGAAGLAVAIGPVTGGLPRALLLGLDLPREPADRSPRPWRRRAHHADVEGPHRRGSTSSAPHSIAGLVSLVTRSSRRRPKVGATRRSWALGIAAVLLVTFFVWERRSTHPMLNRLSRTLGSSSASASISVLFFAMFGVIFLLTQYFQFVLGYTPLEAGIRCSRWRRR